MATYQIMMLQNREGEKMGVFDKLKNVFFEEEYVEVEAKEVVRVA